MRIETILLTTDLSETAERAFAPARAMAELFGARILLAFVEEVRMPPLVLDYETPEVVQLLQDHRSLARTKLDALVAKKLGEGIEVELGLLTGSPHAEIVRLAEEKSADLIVMATHGRATLTHAILGSTTERVLRQAPCPVLVAR